jgi:hypothetical protein
MESAGRCSGRQRELSCSASESESVLTAGALLAQRSWTRGELGLSECDTETPKSQRKSGSQFD